MKQCRKPCPTEIWVPNKKGKTLCGKPCELEKQHAGECTCGPCEHVGNIRKVQAQARTAQAKKRGRTVDSKWIPKEAKKDNRSEERENTSGIKRKEEPEGEKKTVRKVILEPRQGRGRGRGRRRWSRLRRRGEELAAGTAGVPERVVHRKQARPCVAKESSGVAGSDG